MNTTNRLYEALMAIAAMKTDEKTDYAQLVALMKAVAITALKESNA